MQFGILELHLKKKKNVILSLKFNEALLIRETFYLFIVNIINIYYLLSVSKQEQTLGKRMFKKSSVSENFKN